MQSTATRALDTAPAQVHQALDCMRIVDPSLPKVGAVCGKAARTVLCGGRSVMGVPTASDSVCCNALGRYWHKADIPRGLLFVRFRSKAGNICLSLSLYTLDTNADDGGRVGKFYRDDLAATVKLAKHVNLVPAN